MTVEPKPDSLREAKRRLAELLRRILEVDPLACPRCGKEMRIVAFITEPKTIDRILNHLPGVPVTTPRLARHPSCEATLALCAHSSRQIGRLTRLMDPVRGDFGTAYSAVGKGNSFYGVGCQAALRHRAECHGNDSRRPGYPLSRIGPWNGVGGA